MQELLPKHHHGGVAPAPGLGLVGPTPQGGCSKPLLVGNVPPKPTRTLGPYPDLDLWILDVDVPDGHDNIAGLVLGEERHHLDDVVLGQALPVLLVQDAQGHAFLWKGRQSGVRARPVPAAPHRHPAADGLGSAPQGTVQGSWGPRSTGGSPVGKGHCEVGTAP